MARRAIVVACVFTAMGCAAIVGLSDPSEMEPPPGVDGAPPSNEAAPSDEASVDGAPSVDIGYGNGSDGPVTIPDRKQVNDYAPLATTANAGARTLMLGKKSSSVTSLALKAGDVLLVVQSALPGAKPPVNTSPLDSDVGTWELVSVANVNGDVVDLAAPLARSFSAPGAQVVRVLQATTVDVGSDGGAIAMPKWDGLTGGIVAILATESIAIAANGQIDGSLAGYRSGRAVKTPGAAYGCSANEGAVDAGFSPRGEGFGTADAGYGGARGGRGNVGNGGGGGDCHNAGGGGGGNGGRGGQGGQAWINDGSRDVGGMPGAALKIPAGASRLRFGGGGGAGEGDQSGNGHGGAGGGMIFVRAPKLTGAGVLNVRGGGGDNINDDGAGGGGAGGTIYLDLAEPPTCARLSAYGGNGGNTATDVGPGGGGGGGVVYLKSAPSSMCPIDVTGGRAGNDNGNSRGAGPTDDKRDAGPFLGIISMDLAP